MFNDLHEPETEEQVYLNRRHFIRKFCNIALSGGALAGGAMSLPFSPFAMSAQQDFGSLPHDALTPFKSITNYNNYYEFSTDKKAVSILAQELTLDPWEIEISGEVEKPLSLSIKQLESLGVEQRTYHLRCVEGWSMVIPWGGVPLERLIKLVKPNAKAKYVKFIGLERPKEMIGQRRPTMEWPYVEALRLDEAEHPLTLLATGLYGKPMPAQNGAPVRLVVSWKYGFKSIKAITKIEFVETQPETSWMRLSPREYGFYANVNPAVAHPRWSQRKEVRIGETKKRRTKPFNGYEKYVAHLYKDMDLKVHY